MPFGWIMELAPSGLYRCVGCLKEFDPCPPMFHACLTPGDVHAALCNANNPETEELRPKNQKGHPL